MVCACCWRSVDTRGVHRHPHRHRRPPPAAPPPAPSAGGAGTPGPTVLPVRVLDRLPAEAPPAPHRCPPCCRRRSPGVPPERATAATGRGATSSDATAPTGSSRICHLRVDHRADLPVSQAGPRLGHPPGAPARAGRPLDLAGARRLHPAAPGPRPPRDHGCRGSAPARSRGSHRRGCTGVSAAAVRLARRLRRRNPAGAPRAGPRAESPGRRRATRRSRNRPRRPGRSRPRPRRPPDRLQPPSTPADSVDGQPSLPVGLSP